MWKLFHLQKITITHKNVKKSPQKNSMQSKLSHSFINESFVLFQFSSLKNLIATNDFLSSANWDKFSVTLREMKSISKVKSHKTYNKNFKFIFHAFISKKSTFFWVFFFVLKSLTHFTLSLCISFCKKTHTHISNLFPSTLFTHSSFWRGKKIHSSMSVQVHASQSD